MQVGGIINIYSFIIEIQYQFSKEVNMKNVLIGSFPTRPGATAENSSEYREERENILADFSVKADFSARVLDSLVTSTNEVKISYFLSLINHKSI